MPDKNLYHLIKKFFRLFSTQVIPRQETLVKILVFLAVFIPYFNTQVSTNNSSPDDRYLVTKIIPACKQTMVVQGWRWAAGQTKSSIFRGGSSGRVWWSFTVINMLSQPTGASNLICDTIDDHQNLPSMASRPRKVGWHSWSYVCFSSWRFELDMSTFILGYPVYHVIILLWYIPWIHLLP